MGPELNYGCLAHEDRALEPCGTHHRALGPAATHPGAVHSRRTVPRHRGYSKSRKRTILPSCSRASPMSIGPPQGRCVSLFANVRFVWGSYLTRANPWYTSKTRSERSSPLGSADGSFQGTFIARLAARLPRRVPPSGLQGCLAHKKQPPPYGHHGALGFVLL